MPTDPLTTERRTIKVPSTLYRMGSSTRAEDGTMTLSISSDVPYRRYDWANDEDYYEVLDHAPGGCDDARLKAGAALLFNHERNIQLGTISAPEMRDGKCFVQAKLSDAEDVKSYRTRIAEGILKDTSVGYNLADEGECIGVKDGIPIYKFKWAVHEASMVTIPADTTVGVGRTRADESAEMQEIAVLRKKEIDSLKIENKQQPTKNLMSEPTAIPPVTAPVIDVIRERGDAVKNFQEKCKRIDAWVGALKNPAWREVAQTVAAKHKEGEADFDGFRAEALNGFEGATRVETPSAEIGMSNRDLREFSLARAIYLRGMGRPLDGIEKEASDAQAKLLRKDADGFYIPEDVANRSLAEARGLSTNDIQRHMGHARTLTAGNFSAAGALIGTDLLTGSLVELLRNKAVIMSLGPTVLSGLVGNVAIPKQMGAATAYWLAEGGTVTASDQSFAQLGLTPHRLAAQTAYDKQLLAQASLSVEALVRNDIALVMAIKKDLAAIQGSGVAGEPLGILNTTGVQTVTFGATATLEKILSFETKLAEANADQTGTPVWLTNPAVRGAWKAIPKIAASTMPIFLWGNGDGSNNVNGYSANVTNQIGTSGTGANLVYYFVPSELIVADWAGIDVVVNPFSLDSTGQIRVTVTQWTDLAVRHPGAFVVSTDSGDQ